ncbi:MAG TPA: histidinol-phosphate transaminase [Gammaproteobacteria bacterium]|jgi:histidinol-phosphate aminotransferase|nr:histidinol-phosphate transaminase [Gammaproteobacteria bacterium]
MKINITALANPAILNLSAYQPGKAACELAQELGLQSIIKLASNENPLGASQQVITAVQNTLTALHIYPNDNIHALKAALAKHHGVLPQQITLGNGSDNNLELIMKVFLNDGDTAIVSQYAFVTIPNLIQACGAKAIMVPHLNYGHDYQGMLAAVQKNTRLLFLVNPNNPTGTYLNANAFHALMQALPKHIMVVVDEAYVEFVDVDDYPDSIQALKHYPNLMVVRTFSKAYGLAALRLGYTISSIEIADLLNRVKLPFNVSSLAASAGLAAIQDQTHLQNTIALNKKGKAMMMEKLRELKLNFIPSVGNFITVDVGDAKKVYETMLGLGVIVRPLAVYGLDAHLRISIGTEAQNQRCLQALQAALSPHQPHR